MAKTVNYGDPYQHRMTLRLTEPQMNYLVRVSNIMGVSPSEYVRMTINCAMVASSKDLDRIESGEAILGKDGRTSNENVKADCNNIV